MQIISETYQSGDITTITPAIKHNIKNCKLQMVVISHNKRFCINVLSTVFLESPTDLVVLICYDKEFHRLGLVQQLKMPCLHFSPGNGRLEKTVGTRSEWSVRSMYKAVKCQRCMYRL